MLFDLDGSENISVEEIIIIFSCCVRSYCKLIDHSQPLQVDIARFAKMVFLKSDIQADNSLDLQELIDWVEGSSIAFAILDRFGIKYF